MIRNFPKHLLCAVATIFMLPACAQQDIDTISIPETFVGTKENKIDNPQALSRFFQKYSEGKEQARVLHIGDSHIRGHVLPGNVRKAMCVTFGSGAMGDDPIGYNKPSIATETGKPGLVFSAIGINGATTRYYVKPERLAEIKAQKPDLIIMSFGTNEGYDDNYRAERNIAQMEELVRLLRETCGNEVEFLLTTPPGCYKKVNGQQVENKNNAVVAEAIAKFAADNNFALWNMYEIVGGENACRNWRNGNYMQPDGVHFKNTGYEFQGRLLGQAISKAYLDK
ncbi:MAG: GDSL-type esterase/lipase family protein [Bacteroidaceae bacterium]|nr:GDSL-type esterase/lipase family protein [Bacteroidaceae bacterium]